THAGKCALDSRIRGNEPSKHYVPATKYDASRLRIMSAATWTARFRIAPRALAGETLLRARNVVVNVNKGHVVEHDLAGRKLNQLVTRADDLDLRVGPAGGWIHIGGKLRRTYPTLSA